MLHQYLAVIYSSSSIIVSDNENFTTLILRKRKTLKGEGTDVNLSVKEKHLKRKSSKLQESYALRTVKNTFAMGSILSTHLP